MRIFSALLVTLWLSAPFFASAQIIPLPPPPPLPGPIVTGTAIVSSNASTTLAKVGDTITLSFTSNVASLITPSVTIAGHAAVVVGGAGNTWSGTSAMLSSDTEGLLTYSAVVGNANGTGTTTVNGTANGSFVVFDKTPPVITLNGSATITLTVGDTFSDPGISTDGGAQDTVSVTGSVDTATAGTYTLTYDAKDAAGNDASTTRTVTVHAPDPAPVVSSGGGGNGPIAGSLTVFLPVPPAEPAAPAPIVQPDVSPAPTISSTEPVPQTVPPVVTVAVETTPAPVKISSTVQSVPHSQPAPVAPSAPQAPRTQTASAASAGEPDWLLVTLLLLLLAAVGWWVTDSYTAQSKYGN